MQGFKYTYCDFLIFDSPLAPCDGEARRQTSSRVVNSFLLGSLLLAITWLLAKGKPEGKLRAEFLINLYCFLV